MVEGTHYKAFEEQLRKTASTPRTTEWRRQEEEKGEILEANVDSKLEQLGSKLDSKLDAYAASLDAKISGIYQFLSKEKLSNLDENGSSNKTP